jgi:Fe-S cluster assembly iron-binding protein IscA
LNREEAAMLTITKSAGQYLSTVLENAHASPGTGVRLLLEGNALTPTLDTAKPGDATFDHEGRRVLVLDAQASEFLAGSTLDVQATEDGSKLVIVH